MICQIVAMARNRVIGNGLKIPWRISEDFQHFKKITTGHAMIMGRKTWESIGRALPGRLTVVVTRDSAATFPDGVLKAGTIEQAIGICRAQQEKWGPDIFVVGGGDIYRQTLPITEKIYLTVVDMEPAGDILYPEIDMSVFVQQEIGRHEGTPACVWYLLSRK